MKPRKPWHVWDTVGRVLSGGRRPSPAVIYHVAHEGWLAPGWYIAGREHLGPYDTRQDARTAL